MYRRDGVGRAGHKGCGEKGGELGLLCICLPITDIAACAGDSLACAVDYTACKAAGGRDAGLNGLGDPVVVVGGHAFSLEDCGDFLLIWLRRKVVVRWMLS